MALNLDAFQGDPECLKWNVWDLRNLNRALELTPGRKVVVQAGGNLGMFAAVLAESFDVVHTFEPDPRLFALLTQNATAPNIDARMLALGERPDRIRLSIPEGGHDGETYVVAGNGGDTEVVTIDSLDLAECDLIYLDIEGFELFALRGAAETIKRHKPVVAVEINACCERYGYTREDIDELMRAYGYVQRERVHNDVFYVPDQPLNLVCVRVGDKYGPEYVETLFDMVGRNLSTHVGTVAFWCVTDDPDSLPEGVQAIPHDATLPGWWQKVRLFSQDMPWDDGSRVLYFDLDVAVTGRLEDLPQTDGIIQDWGWPTYNSSVMSWKHGDHRNIWADFDPAIIDRPGDLVESALLPEGQINGGDQEWITQCGPWPVFPGEWCRSYKHEARAWPPNEAKVVIFHGQPKPHEVVAGWVPDIWRVGGFTSLPVMGGVNMAHEHLWANIEQNAQRPLPWFKGAETHNRSMVLVCGGPSLRGAISAIKDHKRRGAQIVTVNNTLTYLMSHGITPHAHVMLDGRQENAAFVRTAPLGVQYFLASQCHPDVFDALADREVTVWHNAADGLQMERLVKPHETDEKPLLPIPGGGTVGLRAMWLAYASGYRRLHIYGMDGSYEEGRHHAYDQTLNDGEQILDVVMNGKHYACSRWMARQGTEFQETWCELTKVGMQIFTHGRGLIPDMASALRAQLKQARAA